MLFQPEKSHRVPLWLYISGVFDSEDPLLHARLLFEHSYCTYTQKLLIIVHSSREKINNYFVTYAVANLLCCRITRISKIQPKKTTMGNYVNCVSKTFATACIIVHLSIFAAGISTNCTVLVSGQPQTYSEWVPLLWLHQMKVPVRLNHEHSSVKVVLPYAHIDWSGITSPGLPTIGLLS